MRKINIPSLENVFVCQNCIRVGDKALSFRFGICALNILSFYLILVLSDLGTVALENGFDESTVNS